MYRPQNVPPPPPSQPALLPRRRAPETTKDASAARGIPPDVHSKGRGMKSQPSVLIVDDEESVREVLARWLGRWDFDVKEATSAEAALEVMRKKPVDIVVCDISMPDRNGLWLAEQIRATWPETAIIMATGHDQSEVIAASRELGAVAYVTKPFDPDLLRQAVDHAAGRLQFRASARRE